MSRQLPSLPPLRDMVDMSQARGTAPVLSASWTAINHRSEGPVSPPTRNANPQPNDQLSPLSHHQDHSDRQAVQQEQTAATSSSIHSNYRGVSFDAHPPRFSSAEHQTAGKPITSRQDSAVFSSAPSHTPTTIPPGNASSCTGRSPEVYHRTAFLGTAIHPLTPPSDPSSLQPYPGSSVPTHPPVYDRPRDLPSTRTQQDAAEASAQRRRGRSHSDATAPSAPPLPHAALFDERNSMPPPPIPASTSPSEPLTSDAPSFPSSTGASQQASRYPPDAANADAEGSGVKCAFCHEAWTYPPPDTTGLDPKPSLTYQDMQQKMDALTTFTSNYHIQKEADYKKWKQLHSGGHCNCLDHQPGSKRKFEGSAEDTSPAKFQKRASESPPRTSHLTPPPDQANDQVAPGPLYFEAKMGPRIPLDLNVARVIGPYIHPADDSNNMFYDAHGERKRVKTEETAH